MCQTEEYRNGEMRLVRLYLVVGLKDAVQGQPGPVHDTFYTTCPV